jgi:EF hand domain-containing protein
MLPHCDMKMRRIVVTRAGAERTTCLSAGFYVLEIAIGKAVPMISRRIILQTLAMGTLIAACLPAFGKSHNGMIRMLDTDNDGTVDLDEANKAASAVFDRLDRDHDGTLDRRELAGRMSAREFAAADPDQDGTLTKDEYLAVVAQRFSAADPNHDGTLDARELATRAGQALLRLLG